MAIDKRYIIYRRTTSGGTKHVTESFPIYAEGKRHRELQSDDYVTIKLVTDNPTAFQIGDYIIDSTARFGDKQKYILVEPTLPSYDKETGGWSYELKMEAEYRLWRNKVFKFLTKWAEAEFSLTDTIDHHLDLILANLKALGFEKQSVLNKAWDYVIHYDGEEAYPKSGAVSREVKYIQYSGTDIISALDLIAETWECEWWIVDNHIHFGYCEEDVDTAEEFNLGDNVETFDVDKSSGNHTTRVFPFGGTRNVPETYRKSYTLTITDIDEKKYDAAGVYRWFSVKDANHPLKAEYFSDDVLDEGRDQYEWQVESKYFDRGETAQTRTITKTLPTRNYGTDGAIKVLDMTRWTLHVYKVDVYNYSSNYGARSLPEAGVVTYTITLHLYNGKTMVVRSGSVSSNGEISVLDTLEYELHYGGSWVDYITIELSSSDMDANTNYIALTEDDAGAVYTYFKYPTHDVRSQDYLTLRLTSADGQRTYSFCSLDSKGGWKTYDRVLINPDIGDVSGDVELWSLKDKGIVVRIQQSSAFDIQYYLGGTFEILNGLNEIKLPINWYVNDYDEMAAPTNHDGKTMLNNITDKRIMLPDGKTCVQSDDDSTEKLHEWQQVEEVKIFDDVYPQEEYYIRAVKEVSKVDKKENSDGTITEDPYTEYRVQLQDADGNLVTFCDDYLAKDGSTLSIGFQVDNDNAGENTGLLAGMEFELEFNPEGLWVKEKKQVNEDAMWFAIVRNSDYGSKFPNDTLKPSVGDSVILINFDVRAIGAMGLVTTAENKLLAKAKEYLAKSAIDDRTYTLHLMSDYAAQNLSICKTLGTRVRIYDPTISGTTTEYAELVDIERVFLYDSDGVQLSSTDEVQVPTAYRESRVIGFELCSDILQDTPQLMCGVSGIYSRLADIEGKLRKESKSNK